MHHEKLCGRVNRALRAFTRVFCATAVGCMTTALCVFLGRPHAFNYVSSLVISHYANSVGVIVAFLIVELGQYVTLWGAILYFSLTIVIYMGTVSTLLMKLK